MRIKLLVIYILIGAAMVQYQNCAPTNESLDALDQEITRPVDSIDRVQVGQISFLQQKMSLSRTQQSELLGICGQTGALISWKLSSANGELIERGLAECQLGSFSVELSDQWQAYCSQSLMLEAALGAKASSTTVVEADCQ